MGKISPYDIPKDNNEIFDLKQLLCIHKWEEKKWRYSVVGGDYKHCNKCGKSVEIRRYKRKCN